MNQHDSRERPFPGAAPASEDAARSPDDAIFDIADIAQRKAIRARTRRARTQRRSPAGATTGTPTRRSPRQSIGDAGEERALQLLQAAGCVLLARQLACPAGEVDLVVRDAGVLVFVEVRSRAHARFGSAAQSIGTAKQRRLALTARWWLAALTRRHFGGITPSCRFDVVAIDGATARWHRDAMRPWPD